METSYGGIDTQSGIELLRENNRKITLWLLGSKRNDEIMIMIVGSIADNLREISEKNGFKYNDARRTTSREILYKDNSENLDKLIVQIVSAQMEAGARSGIIPRGASNEKEISQNRLLLNRCITCDNSRGKLFKEISSDRIFCNEICQKDYYK